MSTDANVDGNVEEKQSKSIFDNDWLSTELERFEINYDNISVNDDTIIQEAVKNIELYLNQTTYHRYIKVRQRKYKFMESAKFNECIIRCHKQAKIALRIIDVYDAIVTYYELDSKLCWEQLTYNHQLRLAQDIFESTGNEQLLKQVLESRIDDSML